MPTFEKRFQVVNLGQCCCSKAPLIPANGGRVQKHVGYLWFFPNLETRDKIEAATGERPSRLVESRVTSCIPLPPIAPTLGAFIDPETGYYCDIDLPKEWRCAVEGPWACP